MLSNPFNHTVTLQYSWSILQLHMLISSKSKAVSVSKPDYSMWCTAGLFTWHATRMKLLLLCPELTLMPSHTTAVKISFE